MAVLSTSGAGGLSGCAYVEACGDERMCFAPPPSPCEVLEPGVDRVMDECGVFASASAGGGAPRAGTRREPFGSLQRAIVEAQARGLRHVYACGEMFEEEVTLVSGVHLWGSRRCEDDAWWYGLSVDGAEARTTIAPPAGIPLRVVGEEGATSVIYGVRVVAADASADDGRSSIAMILSPGARAIVRDSVVLAGDGKDGEPGEDAPSFRASSGVVGNDGADACTADAALGALPVVTVCDDGIESTAGYGGVGALETGRDGAAGLPEPAGNPPNLGLGGAGAVGMDCKDGESGAVGADAERAAGALGAGLLGLDGWVGVRGVDGKPGGVGQGGGGGGGGKGRDPTRNACPTGRPQAGAAGGSGGSGGCGGKGGQGGGYGGASMAIVALQGSALTVDASTVLGAKGGDGGVGGTGQWGGFGVDGGLGGHGLLTATSRGCRGGLGGDGGRGGDAGGGLGGHSLGIGSVGASVAILESATVSPGQAGIGGLGANASAELTPGQGREGIALFWYRFDAPDPEPPQ
ncbi:hypothetical protein [Sorangium sp. So ce362]|uniref:hypothetical protein n=1 Tax=Sorangium sp. So ce362 TaxID=3133303 RepID=UPI003F6077BE